MHPAGPHGMYVGMRPGGSRVETPEPRSRSAMPIRRPSPADGREPHRPVRDVDDRKRRFPTVDSRRHRPRAKALASSHQPDSQAQAPATSAIVTRQVRR